MRSPRNFWASVVLLLALPVAVLVQALSGVDAEMVFHFELSTGFIAITAFDFKTPAWVKAIGMVSTTLLCTTFLLQGVAQLTGSPFLDWLGFRVLGQWPESAFVDLLLVWFVGIGLTYSEWKMRTLGFTCVGSAVGVKIYSYILTALGTTIDEQFAALKILLLLPFVWLLFESKKLKARWAKQDKALFK